VSFVSRFRLRLTYANVISTLALFLVLSGGAAYAASHVPANSVGTKQLRKAAVTGAKVEDGSLSGADLWGGSVAGDRIAPGSITGGQIAPGSLTGAQIADGSLTGADVNAATLGQVPSAQRADGAPPLGPAGGALTGAYPSPALAPGAVTGAALAAGIPHDIHTVRSLGSVSSLPEHRDMVECPEGEQVLGGGAIAPFFGATGFVAMTSDGPVEEDTNSGTYNGWTGQAIEVNGGSTQNWAIEVYAICARF
jgi:hypothetical protein